jgi:hypothetical protein
MRFGTEMSNITTEADPSLFAEPSGDFKKVEPEQIRQQVEALFNMAMAILPRLMQQQSSPGTGGGQSNMSPTAPQTNASPAVSPANP